MFEDNRKPGIDDVALLRRARDASIDTAVQQLRIIHELKQQRSGSSDTGSNRQSARQTTTGIEDLVFDLARLSVNHYDQWLQLTNRHFPDIVSTLRQLTGRPAPDVPTPAPISLTAAGKLSGKAVSKPFCIENPFDKEVMLTFSALNMATHADTTQSPPPFLVQATFVVLGTKNKPTGVRLKPGDRYELASGAKVHFCAEIGLEAPLAVGSYTGNGRILSSGRAVALLQIDLTVRAA